MMYTAVGLALADDGVSLLRMGDQTDRAGGDAGLPADALGEGRLGAGLDQWHPLVRREAAGRTIDQVDALGLQQPGQRHALVDIPAAGHPVGGTDTHE